MANLLARSDGDYIAIVGLAADTGETLKCEGCDAAVTELFETDDSVMLCKPCFDGCAGETEEING